MSRLLLLLFALFLLSGSVWVQAAPLPEEDQNEPEMLTNEDLSSLKPGAAEVDPLPPGGSLLGTGQQKVHIQELQQEVVSQILKETENEVDPHLDSIPHIKDEEALAEIQERIGEQREDGSNHGEVPPEEPQTEDPVAVLKGRRKEIEEAKKMILAEEEALDRELSILQPEDDILKKVHPEGGESGESVLEESTQDEEDTPEEGNPDEVIPQEDSPVEDRPVDDTPVDDTPDNDAPVDDTPDDDRPVDDTPEGDIPEDGNPDEGNPRDDSPANGFPELDAGALDDGREQDDGPVDDPLDDGVDDRTELDEPLDDTPEQDDPRDDGPEQVDTFGDSQLEDFLQRVSEESERNLDGFPEAEAPNADEVDSPVNEGDREDDELLTSSSSSSPSINGTPKLPVQDTIIEVEESGWSNWHFLMIFGVTFAILFFLRRQRKVALLLGCLTRILPFRSSQSYNSLSQRASGHHDVESQFEGSHLRPQRAPSPYLEKQPFSSSPSPPTYIPKQPFPSQSNARASPSYPPTATAATHHQSSNNSPAWKQEAWGDKWDSDGWDEQ